MQEENNKNQKIIDVSKQEQIIKKNNLQTLRPSIYIKTLNIFAEPIRRRYDKHYREKKHHLFIDILFVIIIVLLIITNLILVFKKIDFQNIFVPQHQQNIQEPYLDINFYVNQQSEYILNIKNITDFSIRELVVEVNSQGQAISQGEKIIFTKENNEALSLLNSNDEIILNFIIRIKDKINTTNPTILSKAKISGIVAHKIFEQQSEQIQTRISSDLKILADYKYFTDEGEQLGLGVWPPVVGSETSLRIFLIPENNLNRIKDILVSADLPENINWTGEFSVNNGQPLNYNKNNNQITWRIEELNTLNNTQANFEIEFIPQANKVILLKNLQISGTDLFTNKILNYNFGDLVLLIGNDLE